LSNIITSRFFLHINIALNLMTKLVYLIRGRSSKPIFVYTIHGYFTVHVVTPCSISFNLFFFPSLMYKYTHFRLIYLQTLTLNWNRKIGTQFPYPAHTHKNVRVNIDVSCMHSLCLYISYVYIWYLRVIYCKIKLCSNPSL